MTSAETDDTAFLRAAIRAERKRWTEARHAVWEAFLQSQEGLTIPEAVKRVKALGIGQATVYRNVRELLQMGLLQWVHDPNGDHRFIAARMPHGHPVVCQRCKRVIWVDCHGLSAVERLAALETGFTVKGHHLEIFGLCPNCSRLSPDGEPHPGKPKSPRKPRR